MARTVTRPAAQRMPVRVDTLYIEPGSPRENGYGESFNGKSPDSSPSVMAPS
jgi:hypothetical protein